MFDCVPTPVQLPSAAHAHEGPLQRLSLRTPAVFRPQNLSRRCKGEMFHEKYVQNIFKNLLLFVYDVLCEKCFENCQRVLHYGKGSSDFYHYFEPKGLHASSLWHAQSYEYFMYAQNIVVQESVLATVYSMYACAYRACMRACAGNVCMHVYSMYVHTYRACMRHVCDKYVTSM